MRLTGVMFVVLKAIGVGTRGVAPEHYIWHRSGCVCIVWC